jgi:hypothetical protein
MGGGKDLKLCFAAWHRTESFSLGRGGGGSCFKRYVIIATKWGAHTDHTTWSMALSYSSMYHSPNMLREFDARSSCKTTILPSCSRSPQNCKATLLPFCIRSHHNCNTNILPFSSRSPENWRISGSNIHRISSMRPQGAQVGE